MSQSVNESPLLGPPGLGELKLVLIPADKRRRQRNSCVHKYVNGDLSLKLIGVNVRVPHSFDPPHQKLTCIEVADDARFSARYAASGDFRSSYNPVNPIANPVQDAVSISEGRGDVAILLH